MKNNINLLDIEKKLNALKIPGQFINISEDNFYNDYYFIFDDSITINRITARVNDFNFIFNSKCEIIPAAPYVIIRTPKTARNTVYLSIFQDAIYKNNKACFAIGQTSNNENLIYNIENLPHLLVAGCTGSGKSVFLHGCILSTLFNGSCGLVLIDPKKSEFNLYSKINNLIYPVVSDPGDTLNILSDLYETMENRYNSFNECNARNIDEYNNISCEKINRIAVFIDEFSDLVMMNKQIEKYIILLAQKSRAAGIHLIIATQRPDARTVSGLIKANFPARVCFNVTSRIDSRIILDFPGGETLRGSGDGIFKTAAGDMIHFQAPYISTENIIKYLEYYKTL